MKKWLLYSRGYFCGIFACMVLVPCAVFADSVGISVDQTHVVFDASPDETKEFVITVKNISEKTQDITVGVTDYTVGDDNVVSLTQDVDENTGVTGLVTPAQERVTVEPHQSKEVQFIFHAPKSATVGSHRGAVFFRSAPDNQEGFAVQGQIAVHVLVNIAGDTRASGRIHSFDVPFFVIGDIDYPAVFENTGNTHYVPYGEVVARNVFSKKEQKYTYDKHIVFPGKMVTFTHAEHIPSIFGAYRAVAYFVDGEGVVRSRSDYMIGWACPLVVGGVVVCIWWMVRFLTRKREKAQHTHMKNLQERRVTHSLQKLSDEKKKRDAAKAHAQKHTPHTTTDKQKTKPVI